MLEVDVELRLINSGRMMNIGHYLVCGCAFFLMDLCTALYIHLL